MISRTRPWIFLAKNGIRAEFGGIFPFQYPWYGEVEAATENRYELGKISGDFVLHLRFQYPWYGELDLYFWAKMQDLGPEKVRFVGSIYGDIEK